MNSEQANKGAKTRRCRGIMGGGSFCGERVKLNRVEDNRKACPQIAVARIIGIGADSCQNSCYVYRN